jgi:tetratricopeptide (TPR) repeat protein
MYNLAISGAAGLILLLLLKFPVGLPLWGAFPLGLALFAGSFYLISRLIMKKVMAIMESASKDLQANPPRIEKGIKTLLTAMKYGPWQIYVTGQLNAQIGMIYYMKRDFASAFPYLEKAFFKNWVAMGMLGISYMKRQKREKMKETFEKALQASPKEGLLWNLYAYCLAEGGDTEKAQEVLNRGLKKLPEDEKLTANLEAIANGKKMKMRTYGDLWFQFHLESVAAIQKHQMDAMGGMRRRTVRR